MRLFRRPARFVRSSDYTPAWAPLVRAPDAAGRRCRGARTRPRTPCSRRCRFHRQGVAREQPIAFRAVDSVLPSRRSWLNSARLSKRSADCGESSSRTASRRQNLRCGHSVCMALSPAFRLLDCYQAPCCLKNFRAPPLLFRLCPSGRGGRSRMYLTPDNLFMTLH